MPYNVILTGPAQKTYNKLTLKLRIALDRCIVHLEACPKYGANVQRLKGKHGCYRYQVGGWRILYKVDDIAKEVRIYQIRPRGDVYKHGH
ncbi:MAG: type II toxin-antitoxin system RelE family toxin [Candidatus Brocadiales bacterium]